MNAVEFKRVSKLSLKILTEQFSTNSLDLNFKTIMPTTFDMGWL